MTNVVNSGDGGEQSLTQSVQSHSQSTIAWFLSSETAGDTITATTSMLTVTATTQDISGVQKDCPRNFVLRGGDADTSFPRTSNRQTTVETDRRRGVASTGTQALTATSVLHYYWTVTNTTTNTQNNQPFCFGAGYSGFAEMVVHD